MKGSASRLSAVSVPDRARRLVISSFAPDRMCRVVAVDGKGEVVVKGKAESCRQNVIIEPRRPREFCFGGPGGAVVGRATVVGVPQWMVVRVHRPGIHPCDANVSRCTGRNCWEATLDPL